MSTALIGVIALMTYATRALALVLMPDPPERLRVVLDRIPAPLFASLAALSLLQGATLAPPATLCAAGGALLMAPTRSLLVVLVGGLAGYALGATLFA